MPLLVKSPRAGLLAFRLGSVAALRQTDDLITQLHTQLAAERTRIACLLHEVAELRHELALHDQRDLLARADSPSAAVH